ncbi:hypothetical protein BDB01DRAFT_771549 [Pilobolus umbonatus]|nr:hypothetical protein BDB01DRAFT_771549 [Pilobolus umbonatus]
MGDIYNSAFPALFSTGGNISHKQYNTGFHTSLTPPKYPAYLKYTLYGSLVLEQYKCRQNKHDYKPYNGLTPSYNSTAKSDRSQSAHPKLPKTDDISLETLDLRLPTSWSQEDRSKHLQVDSSGLNLLYIGPGKSESHAALARSNFPMRSQCGVFYFEMRVDSKGDDGYIGIGFCSATNSLDRLPGWDVGSWGYHGDDGHSFAGSGTGQNYGPCFSTGDIIGCGVNFGEHSAFYTKNGKYLGVAFSKIDLSQPVYPAVGLRTPGERITVNFGQEPFVYDIVQYIKDQKVQLIREITTKQQLNPNDKIKDDRVQSKEILDQLILSYLVHHGYTATAKGLAQNTGYLSNQLYSLTEFNEQISHISKKDMDERQKIRASIISGCIDEAIQLIEMYYPGLLQEEKRGKNIQLCLKCGKFIEMMRQYCDNNEAERTQTSDTIEDKSYQPKSTSDMSDTNQYSTNQSVSRSISIPLSSSSSIVKPGKRRLSYAAIAAALSPSSSTETAHHSLGSGYNDVDMMDLDSDTYQHGGSDTHHSAHGNVWTKRSNRNSNHDKQMLENKDNFMTDDGDFSLKSIMAYGQHLQDEYRNDTQESTKAKLVEISSLFAYPDPYNSPVSYLLKKSRRDALATEVNAAILVYQHRPEMPALERIYQQVVLTQNELAFEGNGKAALVLVEDYCNINS